MTPHRLSPTSWKAVSWFVSSNLAKKLRLGLSQLKEVRDQFTPLLSVTDAGVIERAAACAMLHSFYTEIEKLLKLIALEWDEEMPTSEAWHRELLGRMSCETAKRPPVLPPTLVEALVEFLAFRHLFRGASIVLMRWEKLVPLIAKVDSTYDRTAAAIGSFVRFIEPEPA